MITAVAAEGAAGADPVVASHIAVAAVRTAAIEVGTSLVDPEVAGRTAVVVDHTVAGVGISLAVPVVASRTIVEADHTVAGVGISLAGPGVDHTAVGVDTSLAGPGVDHTGQAGRIIAGADRIATIGEDIVRASHDLSRFII